MASSIFDWSLTAASNGTADSSINWQEGQLPSTVNNSARQMMTRVAEFLKDFGGTVSSGGTANALTLTANSTFSAYATGQIVGFKATATNTGAATLNVNSIGAKAIRKASPAYDMALTGSEIVANGLYICIYDATLNSAAGGWLLLNPASSLDVFTSVASATTTDIGAIASQNVTVTGTTTITGFGTVAAGTFRRLRFSGILTLTHNATSLILPNSGSNITTAAGDTLEAVSLGSGNWVVTSYERASPGSITLNTSVATTSGTSVDFTGIPSNAKRVTLNLYGISTNGTSDIVVQLGTSSGVETSGYAGSISRLGTGSLVTSGSASASSVPIVNDVIAARIYYGKVVIENASGNLWTVSGSMTTGNSDQVNVVMYAKTTAASLDRIRLTTAGGANTFDLGTAAISWES